MPSNLSLIRDCWRPTHPETCWFDCFGQVFSPITLTPFFLKLTWCAVLRSLPYPMNPLRFAYKSNRSFLDVIASLAHYICKLLDVSIKCARCALLDYSSAFDSIPRSLQFHKLETLGCSSPLLASPSDYFTNRTYCPQAGSWTSKPLVDDSVVLQGIVHLPYLLFTYINDLSVSSPRHHQHT